MNYMIVFYGLTLDEYRERVLDLTIQFKNLALDIPLFTWMPAEYQAVEIVWLNNQQLEPVQSGLLDFMKAGNLVG